VDDHQIMSQHLDAVTEMRFGKTVKMCRKPGGPWCILVEGAMGGYGFDFMKNQLFMNLDPVVKDNPGMYFPHLASVIEKAQAIAANLGDEGRVVDPLRGFMSKYLNHEDALNLLSVWRREDIKFTSS
jgi:hypothetical protein